MQIADIGTLGIVGGGGSLPAEVAAQARAEGLKVIPVNLSGFADPETAMPGGEWIAPGAVGKVLAHFHANDVKSVCLVGMAKRPEFTKLDLDARGLRELPGVLMAARKGDDALLRAILNIYERDGFRIVGADSFAPKIIARSGAMGRHTPGKDDWPDLQMARDVALATGELDIGQGVVVCDGLVLAVEAQEGTDAMLQRCAELPENIRGSHHARKGVLVKVPKPGQDKRIDLPTLGVRTVELAAEAGLAGIGYAQNACLAMDQDGMVKLADELGLFLIGIAEEGPLP